MILSLLPSRKKSSPISKPNAANWWKWKNNFESRFGVTMLDRIHLEQSRLALQVSERSDVGQGECESILVFIAHCSQREAAILEAESTAVPVVCRLCG